ncbi:MAG: hypothetical protein HYU77_02385 [Betaproteobacteria bacterium]|nr:hypothetical protein [Betaproteobacteria bacterium]
MALGCETVEEPPPARSEPQTGPATCCSCSLCASIAFWVATTLMALAHMPPAWGNGTEVAPVLSAGRAATPPGSTAPGHAAPGGGRIIRVSQGPDAAHETCCDHQGDEPEAPFEVNLTYIGTVGVSSAGEDILGTLHGGEHEPNRNGLPLHLLTLAPGFRITPGLTAVASIMARSGSGEPSAAEVEEAYLAAEADDRRLRIRVGRFFTPFGRVNLQHFEDGDFVDKPVIHARLFGPEQLSGFGASAAWNPAAAGRRGSVVLSVQDPGGETAHSFLSTPGEEIAGHELAARTPRGLSELLYTVRWQSAGQADAGKDIQFGFSASRGPNASGRDTFTEIVGADLAVSWNPDAAGRENALNWRSEVLHRRYTAGDPDDPAREIVRDRGFVTEAVCNAAPGMRLGARLEAAAGSGGSAGDPERAKRWRLSGNLTRALGKFTSVRLQFNRDVTDHPSLGSANSVWFQLKVSTERGSHESRH